jgi:hypothetical protein
LAAIPYFRASASSAARAGFDRPAFMSVSPSRIAARVSSRSAFAAASASF